MRVLGPVRVGAVAASVVMLDVASALAGVAPTRLPSTWRQFHGGPGHEGVNTFEQAVGAANVSGLSLKWMGVG